MSENTVPLIPWANVHFPDGINGHSACPPVNDVEKPPQCGAPREALGVPHLYVYRIPHLYGSPATPPEMVSASLPASVEGATSAHGLLVQGTGEITVVASQ